MCQGQLLGSWLRGQEGFLRMGFPSRCSTRKSTADSSTDRARASGPWAASPTFSLVTLHLPATLEASPSSSASRDARLPQSGGKLCSWRKPALNGLGKGGRSIRRKGRKLCLVGALLTLRTTQPASALDLGRSSQ